MTRRQLSMYVPDDVAAELEALRRTLDPIQSGLIPAHVTLCREDEFGPPEEAEIRARLSSGRQKPVTLRFGRPEAFAGHGLLMPCIGGEEEFRLLRERLLGPGPVRTQRPHLTLAHPRNPKSSGNSPEIASRLPEVMTFTFPTVRLIQQDGSEPWRVLWEFSLQSRPGTRERAE